MEVLLSSRSNSNPSCLPLSNPSPTFFHQLEAVMDDFIHAKLPFPFYFQFLVHLYLVLLNKVVSLYEIFSNPVMGFFVYVVEISLSVVLLSSGRRNCSHCLIFDTKQEGIGFSDAVNITRLKMFFSNYAIMIDFLINSRVI